jgi:hypothetical protein
LNLKCDFLVSKFCCFNLYRRYTTGFHFHWLQGIDYVSSADIKKVAKQGGGLKAAAGAGGGAKTGNEVGLVQLGIQLTHKLEIAWFQPSYIWYE